MQERYPGIKPFTAEQQNVFFGREKEIEDLYRLIKIEQMVVMYGKSGLGKSSLINAGILPKVIDDQLYAPISIRLTAWADESHETPLEIAGQVIKNGKVGDTFLQKISLDDDSFWYSLKARQVNTGQNRFILIFDQFEELFSYPESQIKQFKQSLAELIYSDIPERILKRMEILNQANEEFLTEEEEDWLDNPIDVKTLFIIRSDRLHLLDKLSDHLPQILSNNYELKALQPIDAVDALVSPAKMEGDFAVPPFYYSEPAVDQIIDYLQDEEGRVESIQLQLLCQSFEEKVKKENIRELTLSNIGDLEDIIANYYQGKIDTIADPGEKLAASRLIEEGLVLEAEETNMRLSMHEGQILSFFGVETDLLQHLVDNHLLRAEPSPRGGYSYELCHDTLLGPVIEAKRERLALEQKQQAEEQAARAKAREEEEQKREEERQRLEEERKKRRRNAYIAFAGIFLAGIALLSTIIAFNQYRKAQAEANVAREQEQKALAALQIAEDERLRADAAAAIADSLRIEAQRFSQTAVTQRDQAIASQQLAQQAEARARQSAVLAEQARQSETEKSEQLAQKVEELANAMANVEREKLAKEEAERLLEEERQIREKELANLTFQINKDSSYYSNYVQRGNYYSSIKEFDNAILDFRMALKVKPDYTEANNLIGNAFFNSSRYDSAVANYNLAIQNDTAAYLFRNRGLAYDKLNQDEQALKDFDKVLELNPSYHTVHNDIGNVYNKQEDYQKAIDFYSVAIDSNMTEIHLAYRNRGASYDALEEYDKALVDYDSVLAKKPDYSSVYNDIGNTLQSQKKYDESIRNYDIAIGLQMENLHFPHYNKGRAYNSKKDYPAAIIAYTKAIEINPNYLNSYHGRGLCYYKSGQYQLALQDYTKAIDAGINNAHLTYYNRAVLYDAQKEFNQAIEDFTKALEIKPDYLDAYHGRGLSYYSSKQYQNALQDYTKGIDGGISDSYLTYYNRGLVYDVLQNYDLSIQDYLKVLEEKPDYSGAYYRLGIAYDNIGQFQSSIDAFEKYLEYHPEETSVYNRIANAYLDIPNIEAAIATYKKAIELNMPDLHIPYRNLGLAYNRNGQYAEAIKYYEKALEIDPTYVSTYIDIGIANKNLGENQKAIDAFKKYLETYPNSATVYNRIGNAYLAMGDVNSAVINYNTAIDLGMSEIHIVYRNLGLTYNRDGLYNEAIEQYQKAIAADSSYALVYNDVGIAYNKLGDEQKAIAYYSEAIRRNMGSLHYAYRNRGISHENLKQLEEAKSDFRSAIQASPQYTDAYVSLAYLHFDLEDYSGAVQEFTELIRRYPSNFDANFYRGLSYDYLKDYDKALLDYNKCLEIDPNNATTLNNRGYILARKGDYQNALVDLDRSLSLEKSASTYDSRAYAYLKSGDLVKAQADIDQSLAQFPTDGYYLATQSLIYAAQGNLNLFYQTLEQAVNSSNAYPLHEELKYENLFAPYQNDSQFQRLVQLSESK